MTEKKQKRRYAFDAFFISLRTHFNFFRRFISYLFQFIGLFSSFFLSIVKSMPLVSSLLNLISHSLDSLAFGTNANNPSISKKIAFIGYGTLIILGAINLFIFPIISPLFIAAAGFLLGMYFEGITVIAWFGNYNQLKNQRIKGNDVDPTNLDNALTMFRAAVVTFASIALKAIALCLSLQFPAAAICLFLIAQASEIGAILGSIGKEKVNFSRNYHFWAEKDPAPVEEALSSSYNLLSEKLSFSLNNLFSQKEEMSHQKTPVPSECLQENEDVTLLPLQQLSSTSYVPFTNGLN